MRPIRVIAYPAPEGTKDKRRDACPCFQFFEMAKATYPEDWVDLLALFDETSRQGPPKNTEKFNSLGKGLYEFKTWKLRVSCFFDDNSLIICTHGFLKTGQKAPRREIERARKMQSEYFEAKRKGNLVHVQRPNQRR